MVFILLFWAYKQFKDVCESTFSIAIRESFILYDELCEKYEEYSSSSDSETSSDIFDDILEENIVNNLKYIKYRFEGKIYKYITDDLDFESIMLLTQISENVEDDNLFSVAFINDVHEITDRINQYAGPLNNYHSEFGNFKLQWILTEEEIKFFNDFEGITNAGELINLTDMSQDLCF
jgi:hypothetical protein